MQNYDRSHHVWISTREADDMVHRGNAIRISAKRPTVRMLRPAKPSESPESLCMMGARQMEAYAGMYGKGAAWYAGKKLEHMLPALPIVSES